MGVIAAAITFLATPLVTRVAKTIGAIDHPNDRKVHGLPTPTLGGLAIFLGVMGSGAIASLMPEFEQLFRQSSELLGIALAAVVIFVLGALDDLCNLAAPAKLAGQVFAAGILFLAGVRMEFVLLPGTDVSLSEDVSVLVTVVWIVAMINAVNLVDGLDGLAAGIVAIAAASFFVYAFELAKVMLAPSAPLITIIVVGAALAFLRYNFHPARIFMGDSGAMLLGLLLGAATLVGVGRAPSEAALSPSTSAVFLAYFPLVIPLAILAIPLLDAALAIIRRTRKRRHVWHADKEHIHHRLMDLGHGHRQAVIVLYVWSALAAGAGLAFTFLDRSDVIFALPIAVGAIVLYTLFPVLTRAIQERLSL